MTTNGNGNGTKTFQSMSIAISCLSFLMSLGFAFYTVANPKGDVLLVRQESREDLRRAEDRIEGEVLRLKNALNDRFLTKDEHAEFVRRTDKSSDNLRDELNRIRADQVTRSEHQQHWAETAARIDVVRDQTIQLRREMIDGLGTIQKDIGGQYTVGDQIKNLQDQLKSLALRIDTLRKSSPTTSQ